MKKLIISLLLFSCVSFAGKENVSVSTTLTLGAGILPLAEQPMYLSGKVFVLDFSEDHLEGMKFFGAGLIINRTIEATFSPISFYFDHYNISFDFTSSSLGASISYQIEF